MAHRIIIVGGGISGLAAAHRLVELGRERPLDLEVTLLVAGQRLELGSGLSGRLRYRPKGWEANRENRGTSRVGLLPVISTT